MLSTQEIRQLQEKEWHDEFGRTLHELMKSKFSVKSGHSKESHKVRQLKRYVARLKTIRKENTVLKASKGAKVEAVKTKTTPVKVISAKAENKKVEKTAKMVKKTASKRTKKSA